MTAIATAKQFLTTAEVANELGVDVGKITDWIAQGDLQAVNVATLSGGIRPRWRISRAAFDQFVASRQSQNATPTPRKKRQVESVTQYH